MEQKTLDQLAAEVKATAAAVQTLPEDIAKARAELVEAKEHSTKQAAQIDAMAKDMAEFRAMANAEFGKSGADDWRREFELFIKAVWHVQKGRPIPAFLTKAVANYTTTVDGQGGYLVPTMVGDFVNKLTLRHGQIWPHVNKVTIPDGVPYKFPWESTLASVAWRTTQGAAGTEVDPAVLWYNDNLRSTWINGYVKIANEAMTAPGLSIPDNIAMQLMAQIIRKIEYGIARGATASGYPHDGINVASGVNSQTALATPTLPLVQRFIGDCIADHEGSGDTAENFLITTDAVAHVLKSAASAAGMNEWGNPETRVPPAIHGYRLITNPAAIDTTNRLFMAPLHKVTVGWSGSFSVSFNDSLGWVENSTWMMVGTHADYVLGNPDMYSKAVITALA